MRVSNLVLATRVVRNSGCSCSNTLSLSIPSTTTTTTTITPTDYRPFSSSSSSTNNSAKIISRRNATAVIRYDNNCATIPFVGSYDEANSLKERMEANTHKHHMFLVEGRFKSTPPPLGPYPSLDEAKKSLLGCERVVEMENEQDKIDDSVENNDNTKFNS